MSAASEDSGTHRVPPTGRATRRARREAAASHGTQQYCIRGVARSWRQSSCSWWAPPASCKLRAMLRAPPTRRRGVRILITAARRTERGITTAGR